MITELGDETATEPKTTAEEGMKGNEGDHKEGDDYLHTQIRHPETENNSANILVFSGKSIGTCSFSEEEDKM